MTAVLSGLNVRYQLYQDRVRGDVVARRRMSVDDTNYRFIIKKETSESAKLLTKVCNLLPAAGGNRKNAKTTILHHCVMSSYVTQQLRQTACAAPLYFQLRSKKRSNCENPAKVWIEGRESSYHGYRHKEKREAQMHAVENELLHAQLFRYL